MLKQRVLTAIVLVVLLTTVTTQLDGFWFAAFLALVLLAAGYEWTGFIGLASTGARLGYLVSLLIFLLGLFLVLGIRPDAAALDTTRVNVVLLLGCLFWMLALDMLRSYPQGSSQWNDPSRIALMGLLVLLPTWVGLVQLKFLDPSGRLILVVIALISVADISAFFSGRRWGNRKLAPALSPKKTWAGFWGAMVGSVSLCLVFVWITHRYFYPLTLLQVVVLVLASIPLIIISIAGDLFESMLKRNRNLKDSGRLLPGHGGILDRIDSLSAAVPLFVLVLALLFPAGSSPP